MNPFALWFGIFALLAVVMVAPAWMFFSGAFLDGLPTVVQWLGASILPLTLMMLIASWLEPGGA